jgi:serine/threonine-protein kinase
MSLCPTCHVDLEPTTLGGEWFCPACSARFTPCFHCLAISSRVDGDRHTCLSSTCRAFQETVRQCSVCREWSLPDTDPERTARCANPACPPTMPATMPDQSCETLSLVDDLLERIAAQSHFEERYELGTQLFAGGMGEVWQAFDRVLCRTVAVKLARPEHADTPALRGQFLKEARVGGRLLHPNVLAVFDLGVNRRRQIYFTMRFVEGASLRRSLEAVTTASATNLVAFPLVRLVDVFLRACQGVDFAHQHGVIHLDLKPDNVLVSGFNEVFVIDWGLARVDDQDDTERLIDLYQGQEREILDYCTREVVAPSGGVVVGTPGYMAPEQFQGKTAQFGPRTDVYGLGGILYYLLYGRPPNQPEGGADLAAMMEEMQRPPRRGRLCPGILPKGRRVRAEVLAAVDVLEQVCLKALARNSGERFRSAEELIIEVNEWLADVRRKGLGTDGGSLW